MPDLPFPIGKTCDSRNVHQPRADRVHNKFGGLVDSQRIHNVGTVDSHSIGAEIEGSRNFFVRFSVDDHLQHFQFALRESCSAFTFQYGALLDLGIKNALSK